MNVNGSELIDCASDPKTYGRNYYYADCDNGTPNTRAYIGGKNQTNNNSINQNGNSPNANNQTNTSLPTQEAEKNLKDACLKLQQQGGGISNAQSLFDKYCMLRRADPTKDTDAFYRQGLSEINAALGNANQQANAAQQQQQEAQQKWEEEQRRQQEQQRLAQEAENRRVEEYNNLAKSGQDAERAADNENALKNYKELLGYARTDEERANINKAINSVEKKIKSINTVNTATNAVVATTSILSSINDGWEERIKKQKAENKASVDNYYYNQKEYGEKAWKNRETPVYEDEEFYTLLSFAFEIADKIGLKYDEKLPFLTNLSNIPSTKRKRVASYKKSIEIPISKGVLIYVGISGSNGSELLKEKKESYVASTSVIIGDQENSKVLALLKNYEIVTDDYSKASHLMINKSFITHEGYQKIRKSRTDESIQKAMDYVRENYFIRGANLKEGVDAKTDIYLANKYVSGMGGVPDFAKQEAVLKKCADRNEAQCIFELAYIYKNKVSDDRLSVDEKTAFKNKAIEYFSKLKKDKTWKDAQYYIKDLQGVKISDNHKSYNED